MWIELFADEASGQKEAQRTNEASHETTHLIEYTWEQGAKETTYGIGHIIETYAHSGFIRFWEWKNKVRMKGGVESKEKAKNHEPTNEDVGIIAKNCGARND